MISDHYSNIIRVRSCGLLLESGKLLLVELKSPITNNWIWMPPGGAVEVGESLEDALIREFREETGLNITVEKRVHIQEVIKPPIHAIEFYHSVKLAGGKLQLGNDPEIAEEDQVLRNIGFFTKEEVKKMNIQPDFLRSMPWEFSSE